MKKLIIVAVILISSTVQMFAGPIVTVKMEVGRKSLGCKNFGICHISLDLDWKGSSMQVNDRTNELQLVFSREVIADKLEYFEGKNSVTFEEPITITADIQKALGATSTLSIRKGTYKLIRTINGYQINIPLVSEATTTIQ